MKKIGSPPTLSPTSLVMLSIASTQLGSAIAKTLFNTLSPAAVVLLRVGFAAVVLLVLWRSQIKRIERKNYGALILFGLSLGLMNLSFYLAIRADSDWNCGSAAIYRSLGGGDRKFSAFARSIVGGIGWMRHCVAGSNWRFDCQSHRHYFGADGGEFWVAYILLSAKVGQAVLGGVRLALAIAATAIVMLPMGIVTGDPALLNPQELVCK